MNFIKVDIISFHWENSKTSAKSTKIILNLADKKKKKISEKYVLTDVLSDKWLVSALSNWVSITHGKT